MSLLEVFLDKQHVAENELDKIRTTQRRIQDENAARDKKLCDVASELVRTLRNVLDKKILDVIHIKHDWKPQFGNYNKLSEDAFICNIVFDWPNVSTNAINLQIAGSGDFKDQVIVFFTKGLGKGFIRFQSLGDSYIEGETSVSYNQEQFALKLAELVLNDAEPVVNK